MSGTVLLLGADAAWLEAVSDSLLDREVQAICCLSVSHATKLLDEAGSEQFVAAVIAAFAPGVAAGRAAQDAIMSSIDLRSVQAGLPLLFVSPLADHRLAAYVRDIRSAETIASEQGDELVSALARLRPPVAFARKPFATVEIGIALDEISVAVAVGGQEIVPRIRTPWAWYWHMTTLNEKFASWKPWHREPEGRRYADDWPSAVKEAGNALFHHVGLLGDAAKAVAETVRSVGGLEHVHFRFSLSDNILPNVPFELIWDPDKSHYLREKAPIARRLMLRDSAVVRHRGHSARAKLTGPVLFILADAYGSLVVPDTTFAGEATFTAKRLLHLDAELQALRNARSAAGLLPPKELILEKGSGAITQVLESLRSEDWDIVHFAGHSVRSDGGGVYLLLPGEYPSQPAGLRVAEFASVAAERDTRLVVLSSCESSSSDTVYRVAQEGLPSAIGFRWEVDDEEAALFTGALHQALAGGTTLGRAFHTAVRHVCTERPGTPTFASPILTVQDEQWPE